VVVSSYMNVVDYCQPYTPKVRHGELHPIPERSFSLLTQEVTCRAYPSMLLLVVSKRRILMRISPFEYSRAKNNKSLRKEKMREGRGA